MVKIRRFTGLAVIFSLLAGVTEIYGDNLEDANEYFLTGQYSKAITYYGRALATASDKAQIYYNLGVCHEKVGNIDLAISNYRRAGNIKDASAAAARLEKQKNDRKIRRLKQEARQAYDAMNYGVARSKAEEILKLDSGNSWAQSFLNALDEEVIQPIEAETTALTTAVTQIDTMTQPDTVAVEPQPHPQSISLLYIIIGIGTLALTGTAAFFIGRISMKKKTVERALLTLVRLLPAGMLSVRDKDKLSLLFFEKGKVIKAIVEEADGIKIGGRGVAEKMLGPSCPFDDKGDGPWSRFAELILEVYHRAREEKQDLPKAPKKSKRKRSKT